MRVVLDVNVLISALLSPSGSPAHLIGAWHAGRFDLIVSPQLLAELARALAYPKLRRLIDVEEAKAYVHWLTRSAEVVEDPAFPSPIRSVDPGDDYLIALAAEQDAILVSGDRHLLAMAEQLPVRDPATFVASLGDAD